MQKAFGIARIDLKMDQGFLKVVQDATCPFCKSTALACPETDTIPKVGPEALLARSLPPPRDRPSLPPPSSAL